MGYPPPSVTVRVCFVCLGNICRSPTAEGVFRHLVEQAELDGHFDIDSAGTAAYHVGEPPDRRSATAARARGIELGGRARQFRAADFERFDYVIAMDRSNHADLLELAPDEQARTKVLLLRAFDPEVSEASDVPDPYYGGVGGFDLVLDICVRGCRGLLDHVRATHGF